MKLFGSISISPGKNGAFYYSNFFQQYNIEAVYHPFQANNMQEVQKVLSENKFEGFNISMPFKKDIIKLLNKSSANVNLYQSCNTVKVNDGKLFGHNTDINGVSKIASRILGNEKVVILGNGAMGKTFEKVFKQENINYRIMSRTLGNWDDRHQKCDVLINCTSLGTTSSLSPIDYLSVSRAVFDLALNGYKLRNLCSSVTYFSGLLFYKEVFLEQFFLQTGIVPDSDYFDYLTTSRE